VSLDTLIDEYECGADPESIVNAYPTLRLADVYAVLAYYLGHRDEVNEYLRRRQAEAAELRRQIEAGQQGCGALRAKLLARRAAQAGA
jgi:hypothetical protein